MKSKSSKLLEVYDSGKQFIATLMPEQEPIHLTKDGLIERLKKNRKFLLSQPLAIYPMTCLLLQEDTMMLMKFPSSLTATRSRQGSRRS